MPEIFACLAVTGRQFDPDELTRMLGVRPRQQGRRDDVLRNGKPRGAAFWHFSTRRQRAMDWRGHLCEVLETVEPKEEEFLEFCHAHGAEPTIHLVAYLGEDPPAGSLDSDMVQRMARLGCGLDVNLYAANDGDRS